MRTGFALILSLALSNCGYDVVFSRAAPNGSASGGASLGGGTSLATGGAGTYAAGAANLDASSISPLSPTIRWQWQLQGSLDFSVHADLFAVDLFDVSDSDLAQLRTNGRIGICTFSAGTREPGRPDIGNLPASALGNPMVDQPAETWLDVRSSVVRDLMASRLDRAVTRGCAGVLPDAVDGYGADTGFAIGTTESLDYLTFLSAEARRRNLWVGLSNATVLVSSAVSEFDFEVESSCLQYDECSAYQPFIDANKPALHVEYVSSTADGSARQSAICQDPRRAGFSTIIKLAALDAWQLACN